MVNNFCKQFLKDIMQHKNTNHDEIEFFPDCCILKINNILIAKITWIIITIKDNQYDAISIEIINKNQGKVDTLTIKICDIIETETMNKLDWYVYKPTKNDFMKIYKMINTYINMFK